MIRRGFTLLEVMIMSAVGLMLLGVVYSFFVSSSTDSTKMNRKLQSVQAVHLLFERLGNDMKQAFHIKGLYDLKVGDSQGGHRNAVTFYRLDPNCDFPEGGNASRVKIERMEYVYSPVTARVYINGKPFTGGIYKKVLFEYEPGNPEADPPRFKDCLTVTVTGVPDELADRDISEIDGRSLSTLVCSFAFRPRAVQRVYREWNTYRAIITR